MNNARKVIASGEKVGRFGHMYSRAAVGLSGRFLFEGEYRNPETGKRKALLTLKDRVTGRITGKL